MTQCITVCSSVLIHDKNTRRTRAGQCARLFAQRIAVAPVQVVGVSGSMRPEDRHAVKAGLLQINDSR